MNPAKVEAVVRKEFYHLLRDVRSLYLAFALPLLLMEPCQCRKYSFLSVLFVM